MMMDHEFLFPTNIFLKNNAYENPNELKQLMINEYQKDSYLSEHTDDVVDIVVMVMINDDFTGGTFVLNDKKTNFKSNGDVIYIKGSELHRLEKIESGHRKIMLLYLIKQSPL